MAEKSRDDLGLNLDMLDADWLRNEAEAAEGNPSRSSRFFAAAKLRALAEAVEKTVRDVGELRKAAALAGPSAETQPSEPSTVGVYGPFLSAPEIEAGRAEPPPPEPTGFLLAKRLIEQRIAEHREKLAGWREPDGYLVPTEPDADERRNIRALLAAAIHELSFAVGAFPESAEPPPVSPLMERALDFEKWLKDNTVLAVTASEYAAKANELFGQRDTTVPAKEPDLGRRAELGLRLGEILGPDWDGAPMEGVAKALARARGLAAAWRAEDHWDAEEKRRIDACANELEIALRGPE